MTEPQSSFRVVTHIPSQAVEARQPSEWIEAGEHVRVVRFDQWLLCDDLLAFELAIGNLQAHPFGEIVGRRTDSARRRLRIGVALVSLNPLPVLSNVAQRPVIPGNEIGK